MIGISLFGQEKKKDKTPWTTKLSLGAYYYTGNTDKFDFASDFQLTRKDSLIESKLFIKGAYGEVSSVKNKQELKAGLKFDYKPKSTFSPFVLLSLYNNEFKHINYRISSLVGAKYLFYSTEKSNYSLSFALQYDTEQYDKGFNDLGEAISDSTASKFRLSVRPKFKQKIGDNIDFLAVVFYQPNLHEFNDDYLLEGNFALSTKLLKNLALKISYNFDYESLLEENPEVEAFNTSFITSIVLNF